MLKLESYPSTTQSSSSWLMLVIHSPQASVSRPMNSIGYLWVLILSLLSATVCAEDYKTPRNLDMGWDGEVHLGALATFGTADTTALSARTDVSYRGGPSEHELTAKWYRSATQIAVTRRNAEGDPVLDTNGLAVRDLIEATTNDRRFISAQTRWFLSSRYYLFGLVDLEINRPADINSSSRQVTGVGYKLWKSRHDFISAALGVGRKKLDQKSGETDEGAIGYLGLRLRRKVADTVTLSIDMDSDFGGENRFSEAEFSIDWKLREPVSLKFKYEARFNSNLINPLNTFDEGVEAALSVNIEVEVF